MPQPWSDLVQCTSCLQDEPKIHILLVGVGGLGCEILKCLVVSGITRITLVDSDLVTLSNLHRQLLYREKDIGQPKTQVASEYLRKKFPHLNLSITPYVQRIEEFPLDFFHPFSAVIAGLDNISARRFLNTSIHNLVQFDSASLEPLPHTQKPYFDAGTEGFRGQHRFIFPFLTSCFECSLSLFPQPTVQHFPVCSLADPPLTSEDCIIYAYVHDWNQEFPEKQPDISDPTTQEWIRLKALERANQYNIQGVTKTLLVDVLQGIIPAVITTNAIVASSLVVQVLQFFHQTSITMKNYFMYMGDSGLYTLAFDYAKNPNCLVCSRKIIALHISLHDTLEDIIFKLMTHPVFPVHSPTLATKTTLLYLNHPTGLGDKPFKQSTTWKSLVEQKIVSLNDILYVTDPHMESTVEVHLRYLQDNTSVVSDIS